MQRELNQILRVLRCFLGLRLISTLLLESQRSSFWSFDILVDFKVVDNFSLGVDVINVRFVYIPQKSNIFKIVKIVILLKLF
jgi:hypothetical protein